MVGSSSSLGQKQGMTMLSETFAQYSALLVMEHLYGREQIRKFLKYELDAYLRNRGGELIEELPLNRVKDQPYIHYRKGALTMYWLKEVVGEDVVNRSMRKFLSEYAFKAAPYPSSTDFLRILRAEAGPQHDQLITDLFEKITLYDMKASNAIAKKVGDKYQVTFDVEGRKLYADGEGRETGRRSVSRSILVRLRPSLVRKDTKENRCSRWSDVF